MLWSTRTKLEAHRIGDVWLTSISSSINLWWVVQWIAGKFNLCDIILRRIEALHQPVNNIASSREFVDQKFELEDFRQINAELMINDWMHISDIRPSTGYNI